MLKIRILESVAYEVKLQLTIVCTEEFTFLKVGVNSKNIRSKKLTALSYDVSLSQPPHFSSPLSFYLPYTAPPPPTHPKKKWRCGRIFVKIFFIDISFKSIVQNKQTRSDYVFLWQVMKYENLAMTSCNGLSRFILYSQKNCIFPKDQKYIFMHALHTWIRMTSFPRVLLYLYHC